MKKGMLTAAPLVIGVLWTVLLFTGAPTCMITKYESTHGELWILGLVLLDALLLLAGTVFCVLALKKRCSVVLALATTAVPVVHLHATYHSPILDLVPLAIGLVLLFVKLKHKTSLWSPIAILIIPTLGMLAPFLSDYGGFYAMVLYPLVVLSIISVNEYRIQQSPAGCVANRAAPED